MAKSQLITALDIGSSKVATLIAQISQETNRINVVGASSLPSRGVRKGQIVNIEEVTQVVIESVEAAERMAGASVGNLLVNISSQQINSQNSQGVVAVANPEGEITPDDVARVVEAAQAISLPSGQEIIHVLPMHYTVDSQQGIRDPIGMAGVRLEVTSHIITAAATLTKNIAKCVGEIGGRLDQLVYSGLAAAYSTLSETEKELGVVLVDIGGGTTDIALFVDGSLAYSAVIPVGAKHVTNDIAIGLRVSLESAEKIKLALNNQPKPPIMPKETKATSPVSRRHRKPDDLLDISSLNIKEDIGEISRRTLVEGIIRPRLDEIFDLVGSHIKKSGFHHAVPSGLVICGGGAMTTGSVDTAKRRLSLPVRIGEPAGVAGLIEDVSTPAFATSIGLILYAADTHEHDFRSTAASGTGPNVPGVAGKIFDVIKSLLP
jgi:cell division protein FtsA